MAQETSNVQINTKIKADTSSARSNIDKTTKSLDEYNKAAVRAQKATKAAGELSNNAARNFAKQSSEYSRVIQLYASTAATLFTVSSAFQALKSAAETQDMEASMKTLTAITGYSVASMVKDLKELSNNAISTSEAMRAANLAASAGIDPDTFTRMGMAAKGAAKALGRDYSDALDRITKGIIKAEPELLDELGIIVRLDKVYQDYAKSIGITTAELSEYQKNQARTNAVLTQAEAKYGDLASLQANDIQKISALASDMAKELTSLGVGVASFIAPILTTTPGMIAAFAMIGKIITKNWVPSLDEFTDKAAELSRRNQAIRKEYIKQADLLTLQEQANGKLTVQKKIHLTLERGSLDIKKKMLFLEREHHIATAERAAMETLALPHLSTWEKFRQISKDTRASLALMEVDYKAAKIGLEGMSTTSKALLATQHAYNQALLVGKVAIQAMGALLSKALFWVGALVAAYGTFKSIYDSIFVKQEEKERIKDYEDISSLLEDQSKILSQHEKLTKNIGDNYSAIKTSLLGVGRAAIELGTSFETIGLGVGSRDDYLLGGYFSRLRDYIGSVTTLFGGESFTKSEFQQNLEVRKKAYKEFSDQVGTISVALRLKLAESMNLSDYSIKDRAAYQEVINYLRENTKHSVESTAAYAALTSKARDFTSSIKEQKSVFSELGGIFNDTSSQISSYLHTLSNTADPIKRNLFMQTEGPEVNNLVNKLKEMGLISKDIADNFFAETDLRKKAKLFKDIADSFKEAHAKALMYDSDLAGAKRGTDSQLAARSSIKQGMANVSRIKSSFGSGSPELVEQEYGLKIKLQALNNAQLENAKSIAMAYKANLTYAINTTENEQQRAIYKQELLRVEEDIAQIVREQADAEETKVTALDKQYAVLMAQKAVIADMATSMGSALGSTGNVWAGFHQSIFDTVAAMSNMEASTVRYNSIQTTTSAEIARLNAEQVNLAQNLANATTEQERATIASEMSANTQAVEAQQTLQAASAMEQKKSALNAVAAVTQALSQLVSASAQMSADAIGYEIQMEQKRDGQSKESLAKIQKLREKQIKEEAKAKKMQVVMSTAVAVMQAFAQGGPWLGPAMAAIAVAMGAQQLQAIDQATSGQLKVLGTSSESSNNNNSYGISNAGKVDITSAAAMGEVEQYRATGGTVSAGTSIMLGEKGPEKVSFNQDVMVDSNSDTNSASPALPTPIQINISAVDAMDVQRLFENNGSSLLSSLEKEANSRGISITGGV